MQEAAADPGVVRDGLGQMGDVGSGDLADFRHGIDERDLGGEEGVGRDLDKLGGRVVDDDDGSSGVDHRSVDPAQRLLGAALGCHTEDEPVRAQRVVDGETLPQELGVPGELHPGCLGGQPVGEPGGGTGRNCGFANNQRAGTQPTRDQSTDRGVDVTHVRRVRAGVLRSADADEVDVSPGRGLREGGREGQTAGLQVLAEQLLQPRLEEGHLAGGKTGDLVRVHIDTDDLEPELGHADGVGRAQIAGSDHRNSQRTDNCCCFHDMLQTPS